MVRYLKAKGGWGAVGWFNPLLYANALLIESQRILDERKKCLTTGGWQID